MIDSADNNKLSKRLFVCTRSKNFKTAVRIKHHDWLYFFCLFGKIGRRYVQWLRGLFFKSLIAVFLSKFCNISSYLVILICILIIIIGLFIDIIYLFISEFLTDIANNLVSFASWEFNISICQHSPFAKKQPHNVQLRESCVPQGPAPQQPAASWLHVGQELAGRMRKWLYNNVFSCQRIAVGTANI